MERRHPRHAPPIPLVALIDGDVDTCERYATELTSYGFETVSIVGDDRAYPRIWALHPDLILMEVTLPQTDGWELLRSLKHDARTRDIPVVVLTGDAQTSARDRADEEHCAEFFLKPCLPEHVARGLRRVITSPTDTRDR